MDKKYLTIKEYADIRGVSVSSVYKRVNTTLKDYFVEVENHKMLKIEVLAAEGLKGYDKKVEENSTQNIQPSSTSSTFLKEQLEVKDKQIAELNEQIKALQDSNQKKDDFIQEQSTKLTELLEQSNILLRNNQILLADKSETKEETNVSEEDNISTAPEENKTEEAQTEKKSWFKRIFG